MIWKTLERVLKTLPHEAIKLIVVDGVFSMEGDLANLPEIVKLKHKYNCSIMVDEAHGLGVFGKQGRGVCDHFGLTDEVDLIMGTFSKSLASIGGFIASDKDTINFLRQSCRTYIFSASNTPAATAAALEALHIIQNEPERFEQLWDVTNYALKRFREEGFEIGETESPIIPLYVRDAMKTFEVTKKAYDAWRIHQPSYPSSMCSSGYIGTFCPHGYSYQGAGRTRCENFEGDFRRGRRHQVSATYIGITPIYIIERGSPWNEGLPFWKISVL